MTTGLRAVCLLALVAGAASLASCFGRPSRGEYGLGPAREAVPVPAGRRCEYLHSPALLPEFGAILAPGFRGNLGLWGYGGTRQDTIHVSVRYGEDAHLDWVRSVQGGFHPRNAELERITRQALPERVQRAWGFRLLVTGDGRVAGLLPSVVCRPETLTTSFVPRPVPSSALEAAEMQRARGRRFEVQVALDEDGRVVGARLPQSTGSRNLDQYFLDIVRATRFSPRLHDGLPVPGTETFHLTVPRRR